MGLDPIAETLADPHSYGFRLYRRCADAIERLFVVLAQKFGACWILDAETTAGSSRLRRPRRMLEPYDGKLSRTVLRGGRPRKGALSTRG